MFYYVIKLFRYVIKLLDGDKRFIVCKFVANNFENKLVREIIFIIDVMCVITVFIPLIYLYL